ncbi:hypothetical protein BP6252_10935 [Coleophoma cylindrospora]|uniref:S-adenosyl-L-methionine-dependent methyltransferase n=1 Tax=Coleophoma cylindrospora TaxID=1849047 RepID=A0A3D8QP24_9HELO|nr:hypothetical protein BP6252_10935 [Coleophoma cylindrospora]
MAAPIQGNQLEANLYDDDNDSAFFSSADDGLSLSTSLKSSILDYRMENGRTYHRYKDGQYAYPNDELEKDRLDLQHHIYKLMLDGRLYLSPVDNNLQNALDIGTGTGIWAIEFAEDHPSAVVVGTDLSPIQPTFVPPNLSFLIDDASEPWVFKQKFDFIHTRQLHCVVEEKRLMQQALDNLTPGGWFEMQELALPYGNDDNTSDPKSPASQWCQYMLEASRLIGKPLDNPPRYAKWMTETGFVNVQSVLYKWPTNPWSKGKNEKVLGLWNMVNTLDGLDGFTMAMFTRILKWKPEEVAALLAGVRADTKNHAIHNYCPVYVTYGQKPE